MKKLFLFSLVSLSLLFFSGVFCGLPGAARGGEKSIPVLSVAGVINPVVADFITQELNAANQAQNKAFLIELDTPGGLDQSMRQIIQGILGSRIPVVVYVYPSGARAASAGALITLAADFAVMAPGTNIGAATPVQIGGGAGDKDSTMMQKVVKDAVAYARSIAQQRGRNVEWAESIVRESISTPAAEALELKAIDFIADDESALLKQLDGKRYLRDGKGLILQTEGLSLLVREMSWRQKILYTISHPNIAYMLLMLGILGIFFEISQPGVVFPGVIGALALLLSFLGFQTLPVNYVGVLLILLAIVLFILEVKIVSYGMLSVGGLVAMTMGSLILVEGSEPYLQISRGVIFSTVTVTAGFLLLVLYLVVRTQQRQFFSGNEGMVDEEGVAVSEIHPSGKVFVHGEYWNATSDVPVAKGEKIRVVRVKKNMELEISPLIEGEWFSDQGGS
ncbi:MAG: nodulation protein NfeD [Deltaproteobacteria bacterium]|nr:nodulation protein NfeD [Deltaproteobacteria bacterium]